MAAHKVKGRFYTFSASPTGDQLTVHPYRGDLGTFEIGPGGRALDKMTVSGSLEGEERAVAVGGEVVDGSPKAARSCQLPVGDYRPNYISIAIWAAAHCGVPQLSLGRQTAGAERAGRQSMASRFARTSRSCSTSRTSPT